MPIKSIDNRVVVNNLNQIIQGCLNEQPVLIELEINNCGDVTTTPARVLSFVAGQPTTVDTSTWDAAAWGELSKEPCGAAASSASSCETFYAIVEEGSAVTVPAGARQLTVTTPCDGTASCTGLSTTTTTVVADSTVNPQPSTISTAASNIEQPFEAVLSNPVTITADLGQTEVSWLICS